MTLVNFSTLFTLPIFQAAKPVQTQTAKSGLLPLGYENVNEFGDKFASNPINTNFKSKSEIELLAKSNPRIMALLKEYNIPLKVNIEALEDMR